MRGVDLQVVKEIADQVGGAAPSAGSGEPEPSSVAGGAAQRPDARMLSRGQ
jgi:hypothetical protein